MASVITHTSTQGGGGDSSKVGAQEVTPGRREGPPLAEVMADWQARLDAEPAPENLRAIEGAL